MGDATREIVVNHEGSTRLPPESSQLDPLEHRPKAVMASHVCLLSERMTGVGLHPYVGSFASPEGIDSIDPDFVQDLEFPDGDICHHH